MAMDTHPRAEEVQQEIIRRMTSEARVRLALEMSESVRNIALDGLRSRRPELTPQELKRELMRIMYGEELYAQVFGKQNTGNGKPDTGAP